MGLIRGHRVEIREIPLEELRTLLADAEVASFWGHENTRAAAEAILGVSLAPRTARPALTLDAEGYPRAFIDFGKYELSFEQAHVAEDGTSVEAKVVFKEKIK